MTGPLLQDSINDMHGDAERLGRLRAYDKQFLAALEGDRGMGPLEKLYSRHIEAMKRCAVAGPDVSEADIYIFAKSCLKLGAALLDLLDPEEAEKCAPGAAADGQS